MSHPETLLVMAHPARQRLMANVVRDERARAFGHNQTRAAERLGVSRSVLSRIETGTVVGEELRRSIEGGLDMPTQLLDYIVDGDIDRIRRLPSRTPSTPSGIREDLRTYIIEALTSLEAEDVG